MQQTHHLTLSAPFFLSSWHMKAYTMVGEPHYMAPEQISGQGYGNGVDYWSLGILIFVMLHAETPFAKQTSETEVFQNQNPKHMERG